MKRTIAFQIMILIVGALIWTPSLALEQNNGNWDLGLTQAENLPTYMAAKDGAEKEKEDTTIYVYTTPKGKKYHAKCCTHVKKSRQNDTLKKRTLSDAKKADFTACKVCEPPK